MSEIAEKIHPGLKVLVVPQPRRGGSAFGAAMLVARYLRDEGCSVRIMGIEDDRDREAAAKHGFELTEIRVKDFPGRYVRGSNPVSRFRNYRIRLRGMEWIAGRIGDLLEESPVDLALVGMPSSLIQFPAYQALAHRKIPTMVLTSNFASRKSPSYPPVFSTLRPASCDREDWNSRGRFENEAAWRKTRAPSPWGRESLLFDRPKTRRARAQGWKFVPYEWGLRPDLPEIVVNHRGIDWPEVQQSSSHRFYFMPPRVQRSKELPAWLSELGLGEPLIYCNTSSGFSAGELWGGKLGEESPFQRHLDTLVETFRRRSDWNLILSCGGADDLASKYPPSSTPPNVRVMKWVPSQTEALDHAAFIITPGGAGTIRECASDGVPMLVIPFWTDMPGNAARVECRGIGMDGGDFSQLTSLKLEELIETLLKNDRIASRASEYARVLEEEANEERERLARFLGDFVSPAVR